MLKGFKHSSSKIKFDENRIYDSQKIIQNKNFLSGALTQTPTTTMIDLLLVPLYYNNRIDRIVPVPTPGMEFKHLAQAIQDAYNDLKRDIDSDSQQVTLYYHTFKKYQIKPGQPDHTPLCRSRREKQAQTKLL